MLIISITLVSFRKNGLFIPPDLAILWVFKVHDYFEKGLQIIVKTSTKICYFALESLESIFTVFHVEFPKVQTSIESCGANHF